MVRGEERWLSPFLPDKKCAKLPEGIFVTSARARATISETSSAVRRLRYFGVSSLLFLHILCD